MTHYYYYIQADNQVDEHTNVYKVSIGQNNQADRDYLYLLAHSVDHNDYFRVVDAQSQQFVLRLIQSVPSANLRPRAISARNLVRAFKTATAVPLEPVILHQIHHFRNQMEADYRMFSNLNRRE